MGYGDARLEATPVISLRIWAEGLLPRGTFLKAGRASPPCCTHRKMGAEEEAQYPRSSWWEMPFSPPLFIFSQYRNRAECVQARRTSGKSSQLAR